MVDQVFHSILEHHKNVKKFFHYTDSYFVKRAVYSMLFWCSGIWNVSYLIFFTYNFFFSVFYFFQVDCNFLKSSKSLLHCRKYSRTSSFVFSTTKCKKINIFLLEIYCQFNFCFGSKGELQLVGFDPFCISCCYLYILLGPNRYSRSEHLW